MRRLSAILALLLCAAHCALASAPAASSDTRHEKDAVLYFRCQKTPYLGRQRARISYPPSVSFETALLNALAEGPGVVSPGFDFPFPDGTRVLNTQLQNGILFVVMNARLMSAYPGETQLNDPLYREGEGYLKRRLAMDALVCTATENIPCRAVQVLVDGGSSSLGSIRLSNRYYLKDDDSLPPPLTRAEDSIFTPRVGLTMLLEQWKAGDSAAMQALMWPSGAPLPDTLPVLLGFQTTPGTVAPAGDKAILMLSATVQGQNTSAEQIDLYPVVMTEHGGLWLADAAGIQALMETIK